MIVEDKILEYLDGSLSEHESAELLETLAVSPEKRTLLEEHLRLKDILALGRKPYSVPLATERALADRLPILSRESMAPIPFGFRSAMLGIRQWAGSRAIQTAMGVAAVLAVSLVGWSALQPGSPQLVSGGQQGLSANSGSAESNIMAKDTRDANSAITNSAAATAQNAGHLSDNIKSVNSAARDINDVRDGNDASSSIKTSANLTTATTPSGVENDASIPAIPPIHSIGNFSQNDVVIPHESNQSLTLSEIEQGATQPRKSVTIGAYFSGDKSYLPQSAVFASQSPLNGQPAFTLDCGISDNFEIGLEAGREIYAALIDGSGESVLRNYTRLNYASSIAATQAYYFCLTSHYTISPESQLPIRLGLAAGIASTGEPTGMATAGISRVLSETLLFDLDLVFNCILGNTPSSAISETASGGVVGIVHQNVTQQTTITSGAGIRAGVRFRL